VASKVNPDILYVTGFGKKIYILEKLVEKKAIAIDFMPNIIEVDHNDERLYVSEDGKG